ncbi:hypothetical protein N665_0050s0005 [Sinapis alba]|nr:hypothetical protein N665_0050s0005 [Sinapis alba]
MASETNSYPSGHPTPPFSSDTRRRGWWSRPIATMPAAGVRDATFKESAACFSPLLGSLLTAVAIFLFFLFTDKADPHAKFSIQSIVISPSSATYHVDFLVRNPSSSYSIYYDDRDASVRFGDVNVAVFNIIRERSYRDHTAFSGVHERYIDYDEAGYFDITCQIRSNENIKKINCHSCFTHLRMLVFVDSFSISNVSNATADWNVSFVTRSPGNGCKISLHVIKSRLLRGGNLISESFTPDYFGKLITGAQTNEPLSYAVFKTVATPLGNGGGVLWDLEVNVVSSFTGLASHGFLNVNCDGILVNVTVDSAGNVKGSLLGHMRPCEYVELHIYISYHFVSVSNADWRIDLVAKSLITGCKISFHTIKSRLRLGDEVVSESSPSLDGFGQLVPKVFYRSSFILRIIINKKYDSIILSK